MKDLFLGVIEISLSTSAVILVLLLLSTVLNRRYAAKWKYGIWILLALRLAIPMQVSLPQKKVVLDIPTQITAPIAVDLGQTVAVTPTPQPSTSGVSPLDVLAVVWLTGAALYLAVHLAAYWRYKHKVLKTCTRVTDVSILQQVRSIAKELNLRNSIPVIQDPAAGSPMVLGFFHPVLVLPDTAYQPMELYFVLKHELVHMKRHDVFIKLLLVFATAVHWFNPLVYLMQKEAVVDMELSCDERVVKGNVYETRKAYTETLLTTMCRHYQKSTVLTTEFYGGKEIMKKRFRNILNRAKKRNGFLMLAVTVMITLVLGLLIGCSAQQPKSGLEAQASNTPVSATVPYRAVVNSSALNIRKKPSRSAENIGVLRQGEEVEILETKGKWGRIDRGWIHLDYVRMGSSSNVEESVRMLEVADLFCNAYAKGDLHTMRLYLADSYEGDLEIEKVTDLEGPIGLTGNPMPGDLSVYADDELSVTSTNAPLGSTFRAYAHRSDIQKPVDALWLLFIKQENGWMIQDYVLADYQRVCTTESAEGMTHREEAAQVALQLAIARFNNDMDAYLPYTSYRWQGIIFDVTFDKMPDPAELKVREIPQPGDVDLSAENIPLGSTTTMAIDVQDVNDFDTFIVRLVRQENGWRAYDFGFEKLDGFDKTREEANDYETVVSGDDEVSETIPADQRQADSYPNANELQGALEVSWEFSRACLRGDTSTMKPLLADSFQGTPQAYLFSEGLMSESLDMVLTNHANYRLISSDPDNIYAEPISIGCHLTLAMLLKDNARELLLTLIKQEDGWKVEEYSLVQGYSGGSRKTDDLMTDTQEINAMAQKFVSAYFSGDRETVKSCLAQDYDKTWGYDVYTDFTDKPISDAALKGLPEPGEYQVGDKVTSVALEYHGLEQDSYDYLSMYFIKEESGWKIYFYGIEK